MAKGRRGKRGRSSGDGNSSTTLDAGSAGGGSTGAASAAAADPPHGSSSTLDADSAGGSTGAAKSDPPHKPNGKPKGGGKSAGKQAKKQKAQRKEVAALKEQIQKQEAKTTRYMRTHKDVQYAFGIWELLTDKTGFTKEGGFRLQLLGYHTTDEEWAAFAPFILAADEAFEYVGPLHPPTKAQSLKKTFGVPIPSPDQPRAALLVHGRSPNGDKAQVKAVGGMVVYLRVKTGVKGYEGQRVLLVQLFYVAGGAAAAAEEQTALHLLITYALALKAERLVFLHRIKPGNEQQEAHWREGYGAQVEKRRKGETKEISFDLPAMQALHARYT